MKQMCISLDAMGGDHGPKVVIPAALHMLKKYPQLRIILVGDEKVLHRYLKKLRVQESPQLQIHHASQVVTMDESPSSALRGKKDSSMRVAINLVKGGVADACVSAGNTGALMMTARFVLKTLPGIERPAIISLMPSTQGRVRMVDLGANVDSCAEHLVQFALMGSILTRVVEHIDKPTIGLLNNGTEEIKGNDQVKRTAQLLAEHPEINYYGYVEGDDIYKGTVNVVVCDGFVGNVAIKACEGIAKMFKQYFKESFSAGVTGKVAGAVVYPILRRLQKRLDPAQYNGASFLGLQGTVVKSHGGASVVGFQYAIEQAIIEIEENVPQLIRHELAEWLEEGEEELE
jgi:phosphate acyltransferase